MISAFMVNLKTLQTEWPDRAKSYHDDPDVRYENPSKDQSKTCQVCVNFIAPFNCKTVRSPVDLTGWCKRFKR